MTLFIEPAHVQLIEFEEPVVLKQGDTLSIQWSTDGDSPKVFVRGSEKDQ